ncbi:MAG: hypothetical protein NTZ98_06340, partial [Acidobacteria bacterium]|nr:hypothetical protein [Acidobacteriota bacterium]
NRSRARHAARHSSRPLGCAAGLSISCRSSNVNTIRRRDKMQFVTRFLFNLALLVLIGIALFILLPDVMRQVFQLYGLLFGPLALVILVVAALPRRSRRNR